MNGRREFAIAVLLELVGAAGVVLVSTRNWQTVVTRRIKLFPTDVLQLSGRTVDSIPAALGLVALAGVVAVLATRSVPRRIIGAVVAVAGGGMLWQSVMALSAVSVMRARSLVRTVHPHVGASAVGLPRVTVHPQWIVVSIACSALVILAGVLVAWRGGTWVAMSARYENPGAQQSADRPADATVWTALDRGEDPTVNDPHEAR